MTELNKHKKMIEKFAEQNGLKLSKCRDRVKHYKSFKSSTINRKEMKQYRLEEQPKQDLIEYWCTFRIWENTDKSVGVSYQLCSKPVWDRFDIHYNHWFFTTLEDLQTALNLLPFKK
jgi:hypothetical protein